MVTMETNRTVEQHRSEYSNFIMAGKMNAKKLAKMSEEERAVFFEQQRVAEEEAQKNKEEMLSRFLKDKLVKEEQATKLNIIKLQEQWRTIMRKGDRCYPAFL